MNDYILLMHNDARENEDNAAWESYLTGLRTTGQFDGGSSIGTGICLSKAKEPGARSDHLVGFLRVRANTLDEACAFVIGNPVYEAGGTVEVRQLPHD